MTPGVIADSIVNLCGAIGLCVAMVALYRRDPRSPLTKRLLFLLGVVAILFFVRGVAWWSGDVWLDWLSMIPAAMVPLGALVVTEGMLRRHAPRVVKTVAVWGAILLGLGGVFGLERFATLYSIALSLFQLAGFATCAYLLASRDRAHFWPRKTAASAASPSARCSSFPLSSPTFRRWRRICRCGSARWARCSSSPPS